MYLMCQVEIYFYGINSFPKENINLIAQYIIGKLLPNIVNARFDTFTVFFIQMFLKINILPVQLNAVKQN